MAEREVPSNRFESHQIEPLTVSDMVDPGEDRAYFRVWLPDGEEGTVWISETTAHSGEAKGPGWIADKLNRRVAMKGYEETARELRDTEGGFALWGDPPS
jgi:hypothetical protein